MSEKKEGLLDWEVDFIQKIDPSIIRKRLCEEFDYLYSVGPITDAIKNDDVLSHILAYAWKSTYNIALVCKRFWIITKSRAYWAALAKHALKDVVPAKVLTMINLFYFLKETDPSHLYLQALLKRPQSILKKTNYVEFRCIHGIFDIVWYDDPFECSMFRAYTIDSTKVALGLKQTRVWFVPRGSIHKLVWHDMKQEGGENKMSIYEYCELHDEKTGLMWYGQPGIERSDAKGTPTEDQLMPNSKSFGVWK